ncbi:MAG: PIN domain-containing protein [Spirochaetales bacterium]|nr:PIN domain-containing protein [Spirochaetales bacterium]
MKVYLDASVLLALLGPEGDVYRGTKKALKEGYSLTTSTLAILEALGAAPLLEKVLPQIQDLCSEVFSLHSDDQTEALQLLHRYELGLSQAHHAAMALSNGAMMYSLLRYNVPGLRIFPVEKK